MLDAVSKRISERRMRASEIQRRLPAFRTIMLGAIFEGDYDLFSLTRSLSIAEAVGVKVKIEVS